MADKEQSELLLKVIADRLVAEFMEPNIIDHPMEIMNYPSNLSRAIKITKWILAKLKAMGYEQVWEKCPECKGSGRRYGMAGVYGDFTDCRTCKGTGRKRKLAEWDRDEVNGILGYVEDMFPELSSSYWNSKRWKDFKKEQLE